MYPHVAHVFIDGGYLRAVGKDTGVPFPNPLALAKKLVANPVVQSWSSNPANNVNAFLGRTTFYDALPDGGANADLEEYWRAIEVQDDMHLGFGALRGLKRKARQKGVDVQIAVDMLIGAFEGAFDIGILVAGDADFVPVVEEVKRHGVMVLVAAERSSLAEDLKRVSDRCLEIPTRETNAWIPLAGFAGRTAV
jgi:uncharacterized LabA/DUF88 family protein